MAHALVLALVETETEIINMVDGLIIADTHCDTIIRVMETKSNIYKNELHADLQRMMKYGGYIQFFAACINPENGQAYALKKIIKAVDALYGQMEIYNEFISLCHNYKEIENALKLNKVAAILAVEGGDALQGDLSVLRILYRLGVRSMTLTWNYRNEISDGIMEGEMAGGLTLFGKDVVREMNRLGMLIDLSHISEKGFCDAVELSEDPVILSHSNAKRLCNHVRNASDKQLIVVRDCGGVVCVNFCPDFLNDSGEAAICDIIRHIEYMAGLIGIEHVGIGSDFDGISKLPVGVGGVQGIETVFNELYRLNYPEEYIEKLVGKNVLRLIKEVC